MLIKRQQSDSLLTNSCVSSDEGDPTKGICGGKKGEFFDGEPKYTGAYTETALESNESEKTNPRTPFPRKGRFFERLGSQSITMCRWQNSVEDE